jgi:hypothetical protein
MEKKNKYWLDEYGERSWYKKSDITITAHRPYYWVDKMYFIREGAVNEYRPGKWTTSNRTAIHGDMSFTEFQNHIDDWVPIENFDDYVQLLRLEYDARKYNL